MNGSGGKPDIRERKKEMIKEYKHDIAFEEEQIKFFRQIYPKSGDESKKLLVELADWSKNWIADRKKKIRKTILCSTMEDLYRVSLGDKEYERIQQLAREIKDEQMD